ncbi:UvrD-helicase domain-containing protein [Salinispira pacifica]|uniref:DNA 3'-5' helicase n=1 Tax=Salinispira pacifica TaxID=1307761 RepID=V5WDG7_9SPIO|nr:UvrD-helicase domain-containing protein [Salinispira pacifica]AHC13594.1 hypothetical protein L21SP2_0150 [Salinispira pacifica]
MKFSENQLKAIETREHSIVSAGAGAGKTSVLVERYLSLLNNDGCGVENILCLTFTRKAAGEMYERVHRRLMNETENPLFRRQFERFDRARITTIDGFCNTILRPYLSDFGYPGTVSVVSDEMDRELNQFCLNFLSRNLSSPGISRLLEHFSFHGLVDDLFMPLIKSPDRSSDGPPDRAADTSTDGAAAKSADSPPNRAPNRPTESGGSFYAVHRNLLLELVNRALSDLHDSLTGILGLRGDLDEKSLKGKLTEVLTTLDDALAHLDQIPSLLTEPDPQIIQSMLPVLMNLKVGLSGFTSSTAKAAHPWKEYRDVHRKVLEQLLIPSLIILSEDEAYEDMYRVLEEFKVKAAEFKRRNGILFFQDLLHMARYVLLEYPDFADVLRREIRFIMIDEFQDNNEDQKELLFLLAAEPGYREKRVPEFRELRPGVLYFVGDQKQSIYRFRNADVSVFKALSGELPPGGRAISLSENFRSSPGLINGFNRMFPHIMGGEKSFEAEYEQLSPGLKQLGNSRFELLAGFKDDHGGEYLSASEHEAYVVAEKIRRIVSSDDYLIPDEETSELRRPDFEDIAVLYKTGSLQNQLEAMFRRFSIPYTGDSTRSLFHDAPAYDIHSFLKFCVYPEDRVSFASFLRSPMVALGDRSITGLIAALPEHINPEELANRILAAEPGDAPGELTDNDELQRLKEGISLWADCRSKIDRISHQELLAHIWRESGYEAFMHSDPYKRGFLEYYDYLLEFFEQHEGFTVAELLEDLEEYLGSNKRADDLSIFRETGGGVQLMTIHKSKGLEFPVVFLVNTNSRGRADTSASKPFIPSPEGTPLVYGGISEDVVHTWFPGDTQAGKNFRNPLVRELQARTRMEENAEARRLLYVALTRAQQHVIVTADNISRTGKKAAGSDSDGGIPDRRHSTDEEENLYDLLESALQIGRTALGDMEPGSRLRHSLWENSFQIEIHRTTSVPVSAISTRSSGAAGIEPLSGPPSPLKLPAFPPYSISVTGLQAYLHETRENRSRREDSLPYPSESELEAGSVPQKQGEAARLGTLVHRIIELNLNSRQNLLSREGRDLQWPLGQLDDMFADSYDPQEWKRLQPQAEELCRNFFSSELYERICGSDDRETELPFSLYLGDAYVQGQIDLIFLENDRLYILDFKTGEEVDPVQYSLQLDIYRLALEHMLDQLWPGKETQNFSMEGAIADVRNAKLVPVPREFGMDDIQNLVSEYRLGRNHAAGEI